MRLTCKTANGYCDMQIATRENKLEKLGQYEDIEEELGIDLLTFIKALTQGFYAKGFEHKQHAVSFKKSKNGFYRFTDVDMYHMEYMTWFFADYGKTWALTKEELEHESNTDEY